MNTENISISEITNKNIYRNPSTALLYEHAIKNEKNTHIVNTGAILAYSGIKTGRSPKDKFISDGFEDSKNIYWEPINKKIEEKSFKNIRKKALEFINQNKQIYIIDAFAGWDKESRLKIRIICTRAYHALFMKNMLIEMNDIELRTFNKPDFKIINAGECKTIKRENSDSTTNIILSFKEKEIVITGTEYAGEMKKGVFTIFNYIMPKKNILSMHCSATEGKKGDVALLFGLSGTGKTTLSADSDRMLIGDDEHFWKDKGIYNIEGGCYAKIINLSQKKEPDIYNAIKYGTVLENAVYSKLTRNIEYENSSITENTRASYPINFIKNAKIPCHGNHPKNIIFLSCDAFGVLPPISKLNHNQTEYHFISGYTSKIAGTEEGITEPKATFSACFGAAFLVWSPYVYSNLLIEKVKKYNVNCWLLNTGWTGGQYGKGKRISIDITRKIIKGIYNLGFDNVTFEQDPIFGLNFPKNYKDISDDLLNPKNSWKNKEEYNKIAKNLAKMFKENFNKYHNKSHSKVIDGGPII